MSYLSEGNDTVSDIEKKSAHDRDDTLTQEDSMEGASTSKQVAATARTSRALLGARRRLVPARQTPPPPPGDMSAVGTPQSLQ